MEQVLYLDIDTVLTGNIDTSFDDPGARSRILSSGPRWKNFDPTHPLFGASGVLPYNLKYHLNISQEFQKDP
jgi:hypothetical protein